MWSINRLEAGGHALQNSFLVSDRCYANEAEDSSGPNLKRILSEEAKCVVCVCACVRVIYKNISRIDSSVIVTEVVPDNVDQIQVYIYV